MPRLDHLRISENSGESECGPDLSDGEVLYLYKYNYEFRDLGLMKCFRTAAVEADPVAEGSWDAEASVVLPLRFLGG